MTGTVGAVFAALYAAHLVGDFWVQTSRQARDKARPGWPGRRACTAHVGSYVATQAAAVALLAAAGVVLDVAWVAAGLAVSGVTHWVADRRVPLRRLAELVAVGDLYRLGAPRPGRDDNACLGTGAHCLDQAWHVGWCFVASVVIAWGVG